MTASPEAGLVSVEHVLASSGRPLDPSLKQDMSQRFGHDFSRVRVHTDSAAAESARQVGAEAYAVGDHIAFESGRFAPDTAPGRRLLAHELSHTIQQGAAGSGHNTVQRSIGFEVQVGTNKVTTNLGRLFERKFPNGQFGLGKFFHKGTSGVELQTDAGSDVEFETAPFRIWSDLKQRLDDAVGIVREINKDPKKFAFSQQTAMKTHGLLRSGETLEIEVTDPTFKGFIQTTEGFALSQYESFVKEHEETPTSSAVISDAGAVLLDAKAAQPAITSSTDNLHGFLMLIVNYLKRAHALQMDPADPMVVKATFRLTHRTSFSSMWGTVLSKDEKALFKEIVTADRIPSKLGLIATDPVFPTGYWGQIGNLHALFFGGKILVLAKEDKKDPEKKTFHNCASNLRTPGIDTSPCQRKFPDTDIRIKDWLKSIESKAKDAMSPPAKGSDSPGKKSVPKSGDEKGLAIVETRGYRSPRNRHQPVDKWVDFVEALFSQAAACRPRSGGTELVYDGAKPFDRKKCP